MTTIEKICKLMTENNVNDATVIKACELNHSALYDWKKGKSKPTTEALTKIANYFNVSTDYLLGLTEVKSSVPAIFDRYSALPADDRERVDGFINKLYHEAHNQNNATKNTVDVKSKSVKA